MASNPSQIPTALSGSGGGSGARRGSGGSMQPEHVVALVQSEVGKMRAEIEKDLDGKLGHIETRLNRVPGWGGVFTVLGGLVTLFLAFLGVLAWGGDRFNGGMSATGALAQQAVERERRENELNRKLDCLISQKQGQKVICK